MATERHCDVPGCSRLITGPELARQPRRISLPGIKVQATVSFAFSGKRPCVCDQCLLEAVARLDPRNANVVEMPERKVSR
jgi:hypothetical protein